MVLVADLSMLHSMLYLVIVPVVVMCDDDSDGQSRGRSVSV